MSKTFLTDFPDRLSPMLVKELRQGMRARGFILLFLIFQVALALILVSGSMSMSPNGGGSFVSGVIFTVFSIAVLVIQPMRGVNALSAEIASNTIEMMVLTRLTANRIVFGKWIAIVSQSALILTTIIPYLILRYFFGGMVLLGEMVLLALIFLTSMALTAVMVGLSGTAAKLARALPVIGLVLGSQMVPVYLIRSGMGGSGMSMSFFTLATPESQIFISFYLVFISYAGWCALSYGISAIAPAAENHSTIRRLIALGLVLVGVGLAFAPDVEPEGLTVIFGLVLAPAIVVALTEPAVLLPPICEPFARRGAVGKFASLFLLPGWPSGVVFTALLIGLSLLGILFAEKAHPSHIYQNDIAVVMLSLLGGILLPALLSAVFSKQESKRFTNFLLFLVGSVILAVVPAIIAGNNDRWEALWLFIWNPPVGLFMLSTSRIDVDQVLTGLLIIDFTILIMLLVAASLGMVRYRKIMEESEPIAPPLRGDTTP